MRKHIVAYRFNKSVPQEEIDHIFNLLREAFRQVPGMTNFSCGTPVRLSHAAQGFSHCFVMDFKDLDAIDEYLRHQNHLAVRAKVREWVDSEDDIFEIDYDYQ